MWRLVRLALGFAIGLLAACSDEKPEPRPQPPYRREIPIRKVDPNDGFLAPPFPYALDESSKKTPSKPPADPPSRIERAGEADCTEVFSPGGSPANAPTISEVRGIKKGQLHGVIAPKMEKAPRAIMSAAFGRHCSGRPNVWVMKYGGQPYALYDPRVITLPNGNRILLVAGSPGSWHAASGVFVAARIEPDGKSAGPLVALNSGGSWGDPGWVGVPVEQPPGMFQLWITGGGTWQGYTSGFVELNDLAGEQPRPLGRFLDSISTPCVDAADGLTCSTVETGISAWSFQAGEPMRIAVEWTEKTTEERSGRKPIRHMRTLFAEYEFRAEGMALVQGMEPKLP
jgi:hypothetical protein